MIADDLQIQYTLSDMDAREDESGMLSSVEKVHGIIQEQIDKGIASERIILGGFSQGGAVALLVPAHFDSVFFLLKFLIRRFASLDSLANISLVESLHFPPGCL